MHEGLDIWIVVAGKRRANHETGSQYYSSERTARERWMDGWIVDGRAGKGNVHRESKKDSITN